MRFNILISSLLVYYLDVCTDTKVRGCDLLLLHRLWRPEHRAIQAMATTHRQEQASKSPTTANTDGGRAYRLRERPSFTSSLAFPFSYRQNGYRGTSSASDADITESLTCNLDQFSNITFQFLPIKARLFINNICQATKYNQVAMPPFTS